MLYNFKAKYLGWLDKAHSTPVKNAYFWRPVEQALQSLVSNTLRPHVIYHLSHNIIPPSSHFLQQPADGPLGSTGEPSGNTISRLGLEALENNLLVTNQQYPTCWE